MNNFDSTIIEKKICIEFENKALLKTCFTHISYANEYHVKSNENLEYLGDSILGFVIADYLFNQFDNKLNEGEMSQIRSNIVCTESLIEVSKKLEIAEHLLAVNQKKDDDNYNQKQYANLVESVFAGIYLDRGFECAQKFILSVFSNKLKLEFVKKVSQSDHKTTLQEIVQKKSNSKIEYVLIQRTGEDHDPRFIFSVEIGGEELGRGEGHSIKESQSEAAKQAIANISKRGNKI